MIKPLSIYIHWPFCLSLCPYCDFNSHVASSIDHQQWLNAYIQEIDHFADKIKGRYIQSVFFGGGTPSLMNPLTVEGLVNKLSKIAIIGHTTEITLEANPTSYETEKFKAFRQAGVNRVSLGVQSLNDDDLAILGRKHSAKDAIKAIESAGTIFDNYSFDLIYARPKQSLPEWQNELTEAMRLAKGHISLYQLTIEKGTPFFAQHRLGQLEIPSNDLAADMYDLTNSLLHENSFSRYEISNYAQESKECAHNLAYWHYDEYVGIGPGAHGRLHNTNGIFATMMIHPPEKWLNSVTEFGHGIQKNTLLTEHEVIEEILMMGLRLKEGISEDRLIQLTGKKFTDVLNDKFLEDYLVNDLLTLDEHLKLTDKGLLLHSYIVPRIINS